MFGYQTILLSHSMPSGKPVMWTRMRPSKSRKLFRRFRNLLYIIPIPDRLSSIAMLKGRSYV